jgi:hypothetical protein
MENNADTPYKWLYFVFDSKWVEVIAQVWKLGHKIFRGFAYEGMYEVLDYEYQIELKDKGGKYATIKKREKIRYLQDSFHLIKTGRGAMQGYF